MKEIKNSLPFFYIILPTFNRPKLVQRAVKSVLSQNYKNYKLIIFNDGSTEDYSTLEALIQENPNIEYIKSHNIGVNKSRNLVLDSIFESKNIDNSYFFTLSDDDYLVENCLDTISEEIRIEHSIWYCFNCTSNSQHIFRNSDFAEYDQIKYSSFVKNYKGDKHFVFKLDGVKNIRYPDKHFKNGYEHIFYYKIPSKIKIIPKSVKVIEYYSDGLSLSNLYENSTSFSILFKHILSSPFEILFYKWYLKKLMKPKNLLKVLISEKIYYKTKAILGLKTKKNL